MIEHSAMPTEWEKVVSNRHLMQLMDGLDELVVVLRLDGTCAWCNLAFARLLDKPREALVGKAYPLSALREVMVTEPGEGVETWVEVPDVGARLIRFSAMSGQDTEGCVETLLITGRDMTPLFRLQHPLSVETPDQLLPATAPETLARIKHSLQRAQRADEYVAFMALQISGTGMTESGYSLALTSMSQALQQNIRQGDTLARLDSGAYLLVIEQVDCPDAIQVVAEKLSAALVQTQPADMAAPSVHIGAAISPDDGEEPHELVDLALQAMQRAIMTDMPLCHA
ncbi:diguanylate cyclase domain-containing protein [Marinobacterium weihaiense]|uniref:Diguanylate cyclase n=1 Tax=Marinobacterium weihaiense TaxID=2851016 RepID=A0ABS6MCK1_9GAMM|nr:diguanylate cyclase [Marinobacterium weihaiense]MBV0933566.1 diguanylate cyclase [Marinobacterium weihaiense]